MNNLESAYYLSAPESFGTVVPRFSRTFLTDKPVRSATLAITACGLYEAKINGKRIGQFVLAPGWTEYAKRLQVQIYDLTASIRRRNTLDVYVGTGWCCGRMPWKNDLGIWGKRPAILAALTVVYEDGTEKVIVTDDSWRAAKSRILSSSLYDGESYDAGLDEDEWCAPVAEKRTLDNLIPQQGEEIREIGTVTPVSVFTTPKGEKVVDFGQEFTGYVQFTVRGAKGERVKLVHFEMPDKEGNVYTENLRSAKQTVEYVCAGTGKETFKPHFTVQGFRYVHVVEWPGELRPEDMTGIVVCSDMKRTGYFECSDPKVNRLYQNVIWGQMGNFVDVPTDCPQRDERLGWTGDAEVFCKTAAYNFDVEKFFTKWLSDMTAGQMADGGIPCVIPKALGEAWASRAAWGDAATVCPWEIYLAYGDKEILARQFATMKAWVECVRAKGTCETLWDEGYQYGDWLALDDEAGTGSATDVFMIATAYFAYSTSLLIKAGKVLGYDMREYEKLHRGILASFNERFIKDGEPICKTQTAYVICLHFDLVKDKKTLASRLAELIEKNGMRLNTGFVGTAYLLQTLCDNGYPTLAYNLLLQEKFPSWLFSVNHGATTIWEHWDGIREDGSMWSADMNSFNHYAYGAVASFLYGYVCGIRPTEEAPGYKKFLLAPLTDPRLDYARASLATRRGLIRSEWKREGKKVRYVFEIPPFTTALVTLPGKKMTLGEGRYEFVI